jgi:hypothetical protein
MFMAKNTNTQNALNQIQDAATNAGLLLMTAAATVGMMEIPEHPNKIAITNVPVFSLPSAAVEQGAQANRLRTEREETGPHYISYSVAQRTPGRSGKV